MLNILFLCTGNSCRSQMAEALAGNLYPQHRFFSAGMQPHGINPYAVKVIEELGIDMSGHTSKHIDILNDIKFDVVITVCDNANESCPIFTGRTLRIHQSFQDPPKITANISDEFAKLAIYRQVRDQIKDWLINELPDLIKGLK